MFFTNQIDYFSFQLRNEQRIKVTLKLLRKYHINLIT